MRPPLLLELKMIKCSRAIAFTAMGLICGVYRAAKSGRLLPRLTIIMSLHVVIHSLVFLSASSVTKRISTCILATNAFLNALGYTVLILMYRHSVKTIFNRNIPSMNMTDGNGCLDLVQSFNLHLSMLRPLEVLFRFITAPLRVLPDVIIVGETRCGTTSLCAHIVSLSSMPPPSSQQIQCQKQKPHQKMKIKCYTPFCAWVHPELDHKESFYFVGHYLGIVDPYFYRMAFPLKITRWVEERIMGNFFFCFDGCAQYLTSPTSPYLIASAYQSCNGSSSESQPPVLVACVRNPVDQAISWWKYEQNAMAWGEGIGLREWNSSLRSTRYPPKTISEALEYSQSDFVSKSYSSAEELVEGMIQQCHNQKPSSLLSKICNMDIKCLPSWAITWPAGQLGTIGRSGKYIQNIQRYNKVFLAAFGTKSDTPVERVPDEQTDLSQGLPANNENKAKVGLVHTVPLEYQTNGQLLKSSIRPILADAVHRCALRRKDTTYTDMMSRMDEAILCLENNFQFTRRNSTSDLATSAMELNEEDRAALEKHFEKETIWYSSLVKHS